MAEQPQRLTIGDDLHVMVVEIASLKEADINAQVMQPQHFERLTENIRQRGQVESLPYVHWPNAKGPMSIISGHHRVRAARAAGLTHVPVIVDTRPMRRSEVVAKQIAHNELHGSPDEDVLRQMIAMIDNVDDLLTTGLDEDQLPTLGLDDTQLQLPHAEFDWRMVTLLFLPHTLEDFRSALDIISKQNEEIGVANVEQFEAFAKAAHQYGLLSNIRNMSTVIAKLTDIARREIELMETADDG